jgi:hypothetical protein
MDVLRVWVRVVSDDTHYMAPGHTAVAEEDTEFLEVAPSDLHGQVIEGIRRNAGLA